MASDAPAGFPPGLSTDNQAWQTTAIVIISMILINVGVILRLICRRVLHLPLLADDYFIILAAIFGNGDAAIYPIENNLGNGRHIWAISNSDLKGYLKGIYASSQLYGVTITAVKISVLLYYQRIFATKAFRQKTRIVGIFVILWFLVNNLLGAFQCNPIRKAWEPDVPGHCIGETHFFIGMQVPNIILDAVILSLPFQAVWQLQMSKAHKISVAGIFMLGGFSIVIAIVRLAILITRIGKTDVTYSTAIGNWSLLEPAVEIFSACLPTMTPFFHARKYWTHFTSTFRTGILSSLGSRKHANSATETAANAPGFERLDTPAKEGDYKLSSDGSAVDDGVSTQNLSDATRHIPLQTFMTGKSSESSSMV